MKRLLLDESRGIYIPHKFSTNFDFKEWNLEPFDVNSPTMVQLAADLSSPDNAAYWEAWDYVLQNAFYIDEKGKRWRLEQDGDLFAVCDENSEGSDFESWCLEMEK